MIISMQDVGHPIILPMEAIMFMEVNMRLAYPDSRRLLVGKAAL
jgi:hypothetical protein